MRVLVLGSGGREHALVWKLAQNPTIDKIFAAPGNAGIAEMAECFEVEGSDVETVANLSEDLGLDLVVVGPEAPLVAGVVDELETRGLKAFGPTRAAARIEGSKSWAKEIMHAAGVPTARAESFTDSAAAAAYLDACEPPYVIKADGLAAGKGVTVTPDYHEAKRVIEETLLAGRFGDAGKSLLIEEHLSGEELSVLCLTDGRTVLPLAAAQDFKRALDGDQGPNTGGMGAYSPVPHLPDDIVERTVREIAEPTIHQMERAGAPFRGVLYCGLMVTGDGPKVIEFNCRFGDPETQAILPRLHSDLAELLLACVEGNLNVYKPAWRPQACVSVVLASGGYPGEYATGLPITGLETVGGDSVVFHAGTARADGQIVTAGGRVLAVSSLGPTLEGARAHAYECVERIHFEGSHYRKDIALRAASLEAGS